MLTSVFVLLNGYQENCPSENCPPEICPREYCPRPPQKIALNEKTSPLVWIVHPMKAPTAKFTPPPISSRNLPPGKLAPMKILPWKNSPHKIPSPLINYTNERKDKITKCFALKKAVQHNILNQGPLWYTNDLTENTGLRYFLHRMKKIQKLNESENCQMAKLRRTKAR